jgi:hypothetical protein
LLPHRTEPTSRDSSNAAERPAAVHSTDSPDKKKATSPGWGGSDSLERAEDVLDLAVDLLELRAHGRVARHGSPLDPRLRLVAVAAAAAATKTPLSCPGNLPQHSGGGGGGGN